MIQKGHRLRDVVLTLKSNDECSVFQLGEIWEERERKREKEREHGGEGKGNIFRFPAF